jgi:hypothetical protein
MVGGYGATVTATGKSFDLPLVHVWTIQNGKVKRFVNLTDTAKVAEAYSPDWIRQNEDSWAIVQLAAGILAALLLNL